MSACRSCGASVMWKKLPNAHGTMGWRCFDEDGVTIHWDTCSKRRWQQVKATGERFETARASGYRKSVHGTKFDMISSGVRRGSLPICSLACKVPPWEECADCPQGFGTIESAAHAVLDGAA